MAKVHVAMFFGDISDIDPIVGRTLEGCLHNVQIKTGYGLHYHEIFPKASIEAQQLDEDQIKTPDPEDDKIEVWCFDAETGKSSIVWGFWGWHWSIPEGMEQGTMPGNEESLYGLAM